MELTSHAKMATFDGCRPTLTSGTIALTEVIWKCIKVLPSRLAEAIGPCPSTNNEIPLVPRYTVFLNFYIPQPVNTPWK